MSSRTPRIRAIAIVIPAHDEEELLPGCLSSVGDAMRSVEGQLHQLSVRVVLDDCTDRSAAIAQEFDTRAIDVQARRVGTARSVGVADALTSHARIRPERLWIAHTDADSIVPENWLSHQLELANDGADVVVGTVRPDFRDLSALQIQAWQRTHIPGNANGHVHGANLGVRASVLSAVGGFQQIALHEDVRLVEQLRKHGARVVASDAACVVTSGRQIGRAPDGYARYLREDLVTAADTAALTDPL